MRLRMRPAHVLVGLGLVLLSLGIWVEDRPAVAAPLVVIGALIMVSGVVFEAWADIEEMSVSQSGVTFRRKMPSVEELTEAGLPARVAEDIKVWMEALTDALPPAIDARVKRALDQRAEHDRSMRDLAREFVRRQRQHDGHDGGAER